MKACILMLQKVWARLALFLIRLLIFILLALFLFWPDLKGKNVNNAFFELAEDSISLYEIGHYLTK
ncbi:MAG: hypothetical protein ACNS62_02660 [Candidatus Cyclobacteriaceae bacterium M3_2C_046]